MCGFRCQNELAALPPLPLSTFRFSRSLRVAALSECTISDGAAQAFRFPQMKKLELERVSISDASLHRAIAGCPILECLCSATASARAVSASDRPALRALVCVRRYWVMMAHRQA